MLDFSRLGVFAALDADGFARPLAGAGVGGCALPANRQAAAVADAPVAVDGLEALEIALHFAAQIALDRDLVRVDRMDDRVELFGREILRAGVRINVRLFENLLRVARAHPINVGQRGFDAFVAGNIYSK